MQADICSGSTHLRRPGTGESKRKFLASCIKDLVKTSRIGHWGEYTDKVPLSCRMPSGKEPFLKSRAATAWDMIRLIRHGGPALCNIAVTNACNAACGFCNFSRNKIGPSQWRWIDAGQFEAALDILYQRDIRYVAFFGGEPLLHPRLADLVAMAAGKGMGVVVITNGWQLPDQLDRLKAAGLRVIFISIDSHADGRSRGQPRSQGFVGSDSPQHQPNA